MKSFFPKSNYKAFTLIELLVVIVIIGILGSVITASLGSARKQARDTKRVADVKNISQALEQYYTDKGVYPVVNSGANNSDAGMCIEGSTDLQSMLVPAFLANIPSDPMYNSADCITDISPNCHCYIYRTQGTSAKTKEFKLFSKAETSSSAAVSEGGTYYFEAASPTETAAAMTLSPGSQYGNWYGSANIAPTFTRASSAYKNDGSSVASGIPRFETIASGLQGLTVEEGTTNIVATVASAGQDWSKWSHWGNTTYWSSWSQANDPVMGRVFTGVAAANYTYFYFYNKFTWTAGTTYAISVWVKTGTDLASQSVTGYMTKTGSTGIAGGSVSKNITLTTNWQLLTFIMTPTESGTAGSCGFGINFPSGNTGITYYGAFPQVEAKEYGTSFVNGTRNAEVLTVPGAGTMSASQGTVEALVNIGANSQNSTTSRYILDSTNGSDRLTIYHTTGNNWSIRTQNSTSYSASSVATTLSLGLHRIAAKWDSAEISIWIDGVKYDPEASPYIPASIAANVTVGSNGSSLFIDGQVSDVIFSSIARSDAELQARGVLTSLPVDSSTTYKLGLDGSLN